MENRDRIYKILSKLEDYNYIEPAIYRDNHIKFAMKKQETREQDGILKSKLHQLAKETKYEFMELNEDTIFDWAIFYDINQIEKIIDEEDYVKSNKVLSFCAISGKIGEHNAGLHLQFDNDYSSYYIARDIKNKLCDDERIASIREKANGIKMTIFINTFKGDEYARKKRWCKTEQTKKELDEIFEMR